MLELLGHTFKENCPVESYFTCIKCGIITINFKVEGDHYISDMNRRNNLDCGSVLNISCNEVIIKKLLE